MGCLLSFLSKRARERGYVKCLLQHESLQKEAEQAMRINPKISLIVTFVMLFCIAFANDAEAKKLQVDIGTEVVISSDYKDMLEDYYDDVGGGWGWWGFHLGLRYNVNEQFSVTPTIGVLLNHIEVLGWGDDSYFNSIVVPSIVLRYAFKQAPSLFISGEVNYNFPNSGSDLHEFDSGDIGFGGTLGYVFSGDLSIEAGYTYIPVEVEAESENIGGGIVFRLGTSL